MVSKNSPSGWRALIVMGVAGSGKSTVGKQLADELRWEFADSDDFHSKENKAKMSSGIPLTDADRAPWLRAVHQHIVDRLAAGANVVVACSALKRTYRATLRGTPGNQENQSGESQIGFVYLDTSKEVADARLRQRHGHFMKDNMLKSQFETLEVPSDQEAIKVDSSQPISQIILQIEGKLMA